VLKSGHWLLVYNDTTRGRDSLAVSLSDDEGRSWKWTRHLEQQKGGSYHYPAAIEGHDGTTHVVYSYFVQGGKSMKHAAFNEAWVMQGDGLSNPEDPFAGSRAGQERAVAGIKLCWCPPGRSTMGSPANEPERRPDEDQVQVTLTRGFWIGKYELTQGQWKRLTGQLPGELTPAGGQGDDFPVYNVNYSEAERFCLKLTERARAAGELLRNWEFRLPTEAQWEYACRAGTTTATSFGDRLSSKQANFHGRPYNGGEPGPSLKRATRVGSYPANAWGIHDMHGNEFEWCRDWYHAKLPGGIDPDLSAAKATATANRDGSISRVRRGGCWADNAGWPCRSACRLRFEPERRYDHIGFRIVAVRP
jgi:formylglycine-generating enzyme required for sulfatase activity